LFIANCDRIVPLLPILNRQKRAGQSLFCSPGCSFARVPWRFVTRVRFPRVNDVWRSIQADHRQAVTLRLASAHESLSKLIVGSSHLEVGVNRDSLRQEMSPAYWGELVTHFRHQLPRLVFWLAAD